MTRHQCRENAFLILFEAAFQGESLEELYAIAEEVEEIKLNAEVKAIVEGVLAHKEELDSIIASYSKSRAVARIARLNLAVLRMALYELRYKPSTPVNVVVSEAVSLSECYAFPEDTAFLNGVLGAYTRANPKEETTSQDPQNMTEGKA